MNFQIHLHFSLFQHKNPLILKIIDSTKNRNKKNEHKILENIATAKENENKIKNHDEREQQQNTHFKVRLTDKKENPNTKYYIKF